MFYKVFVFIFIIFINGCVTLTDKLVFSESNHERNQAFMSLEKVSLEEARYTARDLKEIFNLSEEKYKIRAAYGLLRISVIMTKNNNFKEALDYCNFILSYGLVDSYGLKSDGFSKYVTPYFLSNLSYILPLTAAERKSKEWVLLADFFIKYKDKYKVQITEKQFFLIREASALNLLDNAFKDGNVISLYDIINIYKNTWTFKTVQKIINIMAGEKEKNKGIEEKYILVNNNTIYDIYKKSVVEIDNLIDKTAKNLIKK